MSDEMITPLSVSNLLGNTPPEEQASYLIPVYQRNYAWEEAEIIQLIEDVLDYQPKGQRYYIGTLVVSARERAADRAVYEVIDGQQRLTTLSLLVTYLRNQGQLFSIELDWYRQPNIDFECREHSRQTLSALFNGPLEGNPPQLTGITEINDAILRGYRIIHNVLRNKLKARDVSPTAFAEYLLNHVEILRVEVPPKTDLNHYFEVMNSRGEQLVKHEVLKASLLSVMSQIPDPIEKARSGYALQKVWDACANMDKYVQSGFTATERSSLFGQEWHQLCLDSFDALCERLGDGQAAVTDTPISLTLEALIQQPVSKIKGQLADDGAERFHSVINFPNFLLHVLRVLLKQDISLDDKRLLDTFDDYLLRGNPQRGVIAREQAIDNVKAFTFALLRCKYLLDSYVIKREYTANKTGLSLKNYKQDSSGKAYYLNSFGDDECGNDINRQLLMLLAAFHVSAPTMVYKHWLNAALHWLFNSAQQPIQAADYLAYLESVAKTFVFDRFLADTGADYFDMIYRQEDLPQTVRDQIDRGVMKQRLCYGQIENNLVFNFLDYLLWQRNRRSVDKNSTIASFQFTSRSSVEHHYPQHPRGGKPWPHADLNSFGNLCLIDHEMNARLNDALPQAKRGYYPDGRIDSIKQYLMMESGDWNIEAMNRHEDEMLDVLLHALPCNQQEYGRT
ncbi:MAG: DUF262 domain-containing protein [Moraxellaceae bacterium]|uniref:GmrSD restriction endonuclease domain-containing protein n=1 Tax=Aeromonas salmonicida TaxID=645 RepID=UPI001B72A86C|nr:DUF262 domain-containing protein [Aeromonas salmonicida]MBP8852507.1 DUF262 domain-containing protein [Moraxellaceae bacterium]UUI60529.1 DUF262 domain-containing HNH endonuclease family protein [Aeromonas salmonicida]